MRHVPAFRNTQIQIIYNFLFIEHHHRISLEDIHVSDYHSVNIFIFASMILIYENGKREGYIQVMLVRTHGPYDRYKRLPPHTEFLRAGADSYI